MRLQLFIFISFISLFAFCSCSSSKNKEYKFYLVNLSTKDTVFQTDFSQGDAISFNCPKSVNQTILVASVHWKLGQVSTIVPVLSGKTNNYLVNGDLIGGNSIQQSSNRSMISFSGNEYLDDYNQFLDQLLNLGNDSSKIANSFVENLLAFSKKYPKSELVGYHIHSLVTNPMSGSFKGFLSESNKRSWSHLRKTADDTFMKELNRMLAANEVGNCIQSGSDKLVFQSTNSTIHPALLEGHIKVVIFWATWCGPCKPQMKFLADLNQKKYQDEPVLFTAVTSEPDHKVVFSWTEQNQAKYEGLGWFHDDHFCMNSNYKITQYPTIMIFDKNDKLVKRDVGIEEVETIVDSLLKK